MPSRRFITVDENILLTSCQVDVLTVDELTLDDLTWYPDVQGTGFSGQFLS